MLVDIAALEKGLWQTARLNVQRRTAVGAMCWVDRG
jgi:hypothetical protein